VFGESDVNNVVNEIRDELGAEALAARNAQVSFDPARTGAEAPAAFPPVPDFADIDRSRIHVDEEHAASITQLVKAAKNMGLEERLVRLEERVVRLERTMMATLNLLQRLIHTEASAAQQVGKPEEQSRS
jgi:hypothetical protein